MNGSVIGRATIGDSVALSAIFPAGGVWGSCFPPSLSEANAGALGATQASIAPSSRPRRMTTTLCQMANSRILGERAYTLIAGSPAKVNFQSGTCPANCVYPGSAHGKEYWIKQTNKFPVFFLVFRPL